MIDRPNFENIESDLRHLVALLGVTADMASDGVGCLPANASPACRGAAQDLSSLMWIASSLGSKLLKEMENALDGRAKERSAKPAGMTGGQQR